MAKALYDGVSGVARKVTKKYDGVSGVARKVKKAYDGVSGVARQYWSTVTPLSGLAVGTTVYIKVNGVSKAFLVVHQGRPSTTYDASCNGTWLMMEDIYESRVWDNANNDYANSKIHSYLNNTFVNLFDSDIKSVIKQVKIPYTNGIGRDGTLTTGSSGLSAKVFLLSYIEVGFSGDGANAEGSVLSYFNGAENSKRVAKLNGTTTRWWLRSPRTGNEVSATNVYRDGTSYYNIVTNSYGVRPALVLPSTLLVDDAFNVIAA